MPTAPKIHSVMLPSLLISVTKSEKMPMRKQADRAFIRSFKTFFITANLKIDLLFKTDLFDQDVPAFFLLFYLRYFVGNTIRAYKELCCC
jgi:hypothetical protein